MIGPRGRRRYRLHHAICNAPCSSRPLSCGLRNCQWTTSTPEEVGAKREVAMFQMIDQTAAQPGDRKMLLYKIGMFIVALAAVGGVVFLCVRSLS